MIFKKVIVKTNSSGADLVSSILIENGCTGTTIVDKADVLFATNSEALTKELTCYYPEGVLVVGVIEKEDPTEDFQKIKEKIKSIKEQTKQFGTLTIRTEEVNSEHWSDIWQDYHKPYTIGKVRIFGTWQKPSFSLFKTPILLNPGPAFGTGQHPSTELIISALQKINLKNKTVLDVGCGSGILGITALKLGAKHATLIDIDDVAIESSLLNSATNQVEDKVTVIKKDIVYKAEPSLKADILVCNISNEINLDYAKNMANNVVDGGMGIAILSGTLSDYDKQTQTEYEKNGFEIIEKTNIDHWVAYVMRKK